MPDRPSIPADVQREIFIESGHRCAICGARFPLERAHIVSWSKSKSHKAENLICLCAGCHESMDKGDFDQKTLKEYKRRPWVNRQHEAVRQDIQSTTEVELTIKMEISQFDERQKLWLRHGLADFLKISSEDIEITEVREGSVKVTVEIPKESSDVLLTAYKSGDIRSLKTFNIVKIRKVDRYVGTIVGESTSRELRLALAHETVREQDIIAVDAELKKPDSDDETEKIRVWAKVQRIERINPLFPSEAGHELAATQTDPFDTVLSLSREMVTAVCQVLGAEPLEGSSNGNLNQLRYPAKPATRAYRPRSNDIARIVVGDLQAQQMRALDLATLSNRPEVGVMVDGHDIVTRHLAILAMTGAGKSVTARRIIEELAKKNYPIVIFDPHGDYTGLADVPSLRNRVTRYYAKFPVFEEDSETISEIVNTLGYPLTDTMRTRFGDVFRFAQGFIKADKEEIVDRTTWLAELLGRPEILKYGLDANLYLVANLTEAGELALRNEDANAKQRLVGQLEEWGWKNFKNYSGTDARTLEGIKKRTYRAAATLQRMERTNQKIALSAEPLPTDRKQLVKYGKVSVVALAGYTGDFQATIYNLIAEDIFSARVNGDLKLPVLLLLEEAHNFAPARAATEAEQRAITTTKQIAQEGRKFGVGLILISQRPSRLDETTLSQCNSYIIMRMVNPADQNFIRRVIESLGEDEARMLPDLNVGEAVLSGQFINFPVLVKIKEPESQGEREERDAFEVLEEAYQTVRS